jgi:hypothetical protein
MRFVALGQRRQVGRDASRRDRGQIGDRRGGQPVRVPVEVPPVSVQRVAGQPALDGQVVEIPADRTTQRGGRADCPAGRRVRVCALRAGWIQPSTSASVMWAIPCASATGPYVT